jgi:hypothetical protein
MARGSNSPFLESGKNYFTPETVLMLGGEDMIQQWLRRFVVMLVLGTVFATGPWTHAQAPAPPFPQRPLVQPQAPPPTIISGNDIGFRIDRYNGETPVGTWVVRLNGQWVEPSYSASMKRVTSK